MVLFKKSFWAGMWFKICLEPGYDCIHDHEAWQNSTYCIRKRGAGSLEMSSVSEHILAVILDLTTDESSISSSLGYPKIMKRFRIIDNISWWQNISLAQIWIFYCRLLILCYSFNIWYKSNQSCHLVISFCISVTFYPVSLCFKSTWDIFT